MNLINTSFYTALTTAIKITTGLLINKIISVSLGPSGLAAIGQYQNFIQLVTSISQLSTNSGVVKYTAQYNSNSDRRELITFLNTSFTINVIGAILVGLIILVFSKTLADKVLNTSDYQLVIIVLGLSLIFNCLNSFILSIINGLREIRAWAIISLIQSIISLIFTAVLCVYFGLLGALLSLSINQAIIFLFLLFRLRTNKFLNIPKFALNLDKKCAKELVKFALMGMSSALVIPLTLIFVRNQLINTIDLQAGGQWQAIYYISFAFLMMYSAIINVYYLPTISATINNKDVWREIKKGVFLLLPMLAFGSSILFMFREHIILLLFTEDFLMIKDFLFWQILGDVFKVLSFLFGIIITARANIKLYVCLELFTNVNFMISAMIFIDINGIAGATHAYLYTYVIHFFLALLLTKRYWEC